MDNNKTYIWYAGYGSNLNMQRFLCYISGDQPTYGQKPAKGCADKSLPLENRPIRIPFSLYFALPDKRNETQNWGKGGVAFIRNTRSGDFTLGRMWKVTMAQYEEIRDQEGRGWYDVEIPLGEEEGVPVYTITNGQILNNILPPSRLYLKTIIQGLKETFNVTSEQIAAYLLTKDGIRNFYKQSELLEI
ncbi:MAG: hypothetical protein V1647_05695 [Pseudomonadota bacterium]